MSRRFLACATGALVAACGLGVNGLQSGSDGGTSGPDGQADVSNGGHDAAPDVTTGDGGGDVMTADAKGDVVIEATPADGCVATGPEDCTNGKDDDCNGLTDCADPACTSAGFLCVPAIPSGWDYVAFNAASRPTCAGGLTGQAYDVDPTDLTSQAQCGCTCSVSAAPSCDTGNITASVGPTNTCMMTGPMPYPANGGLCSAMGLSVAAFVNASGPPPSGGSCSPQTSDVNPSTGATQGEACGGEAMFGAGCGTGQVCALAPSPFQGCVHHGGHVGCPATGYTGGYNVGTLHDTRGCSQCACTGSPMTTCGAGSWAFFDTTDCSGTAGLTIQADGQCDGNTGDPTHTFKSNMYSSSPGPETCAQPAAPSPTGSVQLQNADTICCP
jgi:hypothetical protein